MNVASIRSWLMQAPKPAKVRLTDNEGETKELEVSKRPVIRTAESIVAIDPELIEAIGPNGDLLRALRPRFDAEPSGSPAIPAGLVSDPVALTLTHLANLIHRAYEHSTEISFNKMVEVFERMNERSENIERRLERAEAAYRREQSDRIDDLWDRAEEVAAAGGSRDQIMNTLFTSWMSGRAQQAQQQGEPKAPQEPTRRAKPNGGQQS